MGSSPVNKTIKIVVNNILAQTTKPELAQCFHAEIFSPMATGLLKAIKMGLLKTWTGLTEGFINKNIEKSMKKTMGHLHMRQYRLQ